MGVINEIFSQNKISFSTIEELIKNFLTKTKNKSKNITALHEIGLLKEYSFAKSEKSNRFINISKNNRIIKHYISPSELKENFVEWTKYLFDINEDDLDIVNQKLDNLKQKPLNKTFFENNLKKYLFKSKSFIELIKKGIPKNLREFVWDIAIGEKYGNHKYFNFDEEEKIYNSILKNAKKNAQIEKDLERTFIKKSEQSQKNIEKLRNILNCINNYNNGYCQGMNFIAGFLLKLTNFDEIQTFYIFRNILKDIKGYFEDDFPLLKKNIFIFDKYFKELYPKLYKHFKKAELYNEFWVGKWFQSLFTLSLPFDELCNIWDVLIIKGFDFIIYISLAIIGSIKNELLELKDSSDILAYLQNVLNPNELISINQELLNEQEKNYIIPLSDIINKAFKKEKQIKENYNIIFNEKYNIENNLNRSSLKLKKEKTDIHNEHNDYDSVCTKCTIETDNSIQNKNSFSSKNSTCSSNSSNIRCHIKNMKSSNLIKTQYNINNLKSNLCNIEFGLNNNNNNQILQKSTFDFSRNNKVLNINDNIIKMNTNGNNPNNLRNIFNINYPLQSNQCIYYPNNNLNCNLVDNRLQYTNYLVYYA